MKLLKRLLPFSVAAAILVLLLRQVPAADVAQMLAALDWRWLLVGLGAYIATNIFRAYRYGVLLEQVPSLRMLPEMFAVSLFNNTLPSRTGEVSFPYFMYRRHGVAVGESSAALIVARILDYAAVAALYIVFATLNLDQLAPGASAAVLVVAAFLLVSFCILLAAPWVGERLMNALEWFLRRFRLDQKRLGLVLLKFGRQAVDSLGKTRTKRTYLRSFAWSLLIWLGTFAWFAAFMRAIGLVEPYPLVIVGATFAVLAKAIPLVTIGGLGAHEAGWTVGFMLVGMSTGQAVASGFAVNILTLLASVVCGSAALGWMWLMPRLHRRQSAAAGAHLSGRSSQ